MAINYLHNLDLNKNELQNAKIHVLASAPSGPAEGQIYYNSTDNRLYFYNGANWVDASGDIKSVNSNNTSQLTVTDSTGPNPSINVITSAITNGGVALATGDQIYDFVINQNYLTGNESITLSGDLFGSGTTEIEATIAFGAVEADMLNDNIISGQPALQTIIAPGDTLLVDQNGVLIKADFNALQTYMQNSLLFTTNTDNDVNVSNLTTRLSEITENVIIGDFTDVTVTTSGDLIVTGDLTVNGTTTTINSTTVAIDDLNFSIATDAADSAAANGAGITIGGADATFTYTHSDTSWNMNKSLNITGDLSLTGSITSIDGAAPADGQLLIGHGANGDMQLATLTPGDGIDITNAAGSITVSAEAASATNPGIVELATSAEALAGTNGTRAVTPSGLAARSFATSIGNGSLTTIDVSHSLGTRDVIVQIYDNSTYDTVFADVVRTDTSKVTVSFTSAPTTNAYRVLVTKID